MWPDAGSAQSVPPRPPQDSHRIPWVVLTRMLLEPESCPSGAFFFGAMTARPVRSSSCAAPIIPVANAAHTPEDVADRELIATMPRSALVLRRRRPVV